MGVQEEKCKSAERRCHIFLTDRESARMTHFDTPIVK